MAGVKTRYRYVRTKAELKHFVKEFKKSRYRWLHLSVHGNKDLVALTLDQLSGDEFVRIVGPAMDGGRRLFLSTCKASTPELAASVFKHGEALSVAGPIRKIRFSDSASFWSSFYHLMFKRQRGRMLGRDVEQVMALMGDAVGRRFRLLQRGTEGGILNKEVPAKLSGKKKKVKKA